MQEAAERKREIEDIKAPKQEQNQFQDHTTAELGILHAELGELGGDLNDQEVRLSTVEKCVSNTKRTMSMLRDGCMMVHLE